ncbi:hypothetical protein [Undibacterium sp. TS12]|uniref:hypothetical protein n=1 Tax=Undibacterium sp. TS12 TaxID=2908202 RepID=UPI001F4CD77D|nr:hypothetical protein [Undibacterium sp. TS12]MCH8622939.1 hypothetical protein [Undibacterium sp. TS12]
MMERIIVCFVIVAPEFIDGEPNTEGMRLAQELNANCEAASQDQDAVWKELYQLDEELIRKYQLDVDVVTYRQDNSSQVDYDFISN